MASGPGPAELSAGQFGSKTELSSASLRDNSVLEPDWLSEYTFLEILQYCDLRRDGYAISKFCRCFRRIMLEMFEKVKLPLPGWVASSLPLLQYITQEAAEIRPRRLTITTEEVQEIFVRDDVEAVRNLEKCGYRMTNFSVCAAVACNALHCLEYVAKAGFSTAEAYPPRSLGTSGRFLSTPVTVKNMRAWSLQNGCFAAIPGRFASIPWRFALQNSREAQLPAADYFACYDLLGRLGYPTPDLSEQLKYAKYGGVENVCALFGRPLAGLLTERADLLPLLAEAARHERLGGPPQNSGGADR